MDIIEEKRKLPDVSRTAFYFSYGSNMLPSHLQKCKEIEAYSIRRGIINGWRLSFSCAISTNKSDPCFANIVPHKIDSNEIPYVHGCIIEVNPVCFEQLDAYEFTYVRRKVEAQIYDADGGGIINVWTYIMDKEHETYLNQNYSSQKYEFIEKPPSKNYLDILIKGAKAIKLDKYYIEYIESQRFQNYLILQPQRIEEYRIIFAMHDVIHWTDRKYRKNKIKIDKNGTIKGPIMVLKGIVFDLNNSPKYFQESYGGKDITLKQALRWAHSNAKNTKCRNSFQYQQKLFINNVLMGALCGGSILGKAVGKLSKNDKYGYHYYKW